MISPDNQKLAQFNAEAIPVNVIWRRAKLAASDAVMEYVEKNGEPVDSRTSRSNLLEVDWSNI